ncbi:MAG: DNA-formamidopyrimidine glycosylase [Bacilli bacterium]|nr:DNA-formamidopyrimidine glycosylase [Bacilli bacterium]MDD3304958.1 DNA-formamidopyrimidine glycosylase [Bacilli bacterium]MDD4054071.1 DNA-formamidopyrimidine glycosylase [Bacilli bacterium]MDD4411409.1 DNA-formamidopyrimidine glycosylase [Bacilli bacterium]
MPELPEVETVKEKLKPRLINKQIIDVSVYWPNVIANIPVAEFENNLKNQVFIDIKRRGKWLVFELTDYHLLVHLRMEGKFFFKSRTDEKNKHEHVIFRFEDIELRFHDVRKFGKMYLLGKDDLSTAKPLSELGLEPDDDNLTVDYLKDKYKRKNLSIKEALLDQRIITGIGNIYADEILFLSKINPYRKAKDLNSRELKSIIDNTRSVLKQAIIKGGTTIRSYVSLDNKKGEFQNYLLVHGKANLPCSVCGTPIIKEFIGGRGTYYCATCQNKKR